VTGFTESVVEQAALAWLESVGWRVRSGAEIAPGEPAAERDDYGQVVLALRLRDALARLNPALPAEALDDAFRKLTRPEGVDLIVRNRALHRLLVDGVTVEYRDAGGSIRGAQARVIDFGDPAGNDWLAVNQFSVVENKHSAAAGCGAVRQWPAARRVGAEERCGRERHDLERFPAVADLPDRGADAVRAERAAGRLRRRGGAGGHARRRARVVTGAWAWSGTRRARARA
jgi:hypothetical protein